MGDPLHCSRCGGWFEDIHALETHQCSGSVVVPWWMHYEADLELMDPGPSNWTFKLYRVMNNAVGRNEVANSGGTRYATRESAIAAAIDKAREDVLQLQQRPGRIETVRIEL